MPERIQRKRVKGWRAPEGSVYVGRPTKWGNRFGNDRTAESRAGATALYRAWIATRPDVIEQAREELAGKNLLCWCPTDGRCHADVLLRVANGEQP